MLGAKPYEAPALAAFGQRRLVPRACVVDNKAHVRNFLRKALDDLGFITCECAAPTSLKPTVMEQRPDLLALGLSGGGIAANAMLETLAALEFAGHVLVFGPRASPMTAAILSIGAQLGLGMLPLLPTPFGDEDLRTSVAVLRSEGPPPSVATGAISWPNTAMSKLPSIFRSPSSGVPTPPPCWRIDCRTIRLSRG